VNAHNRRLLLTLACALGLATTVSLGRWQLSRAAQKEALQAGKEAQAGKPLLDNAAVLGAPELAALVQQRAALRGTWESGHTVFLDNRQMNGKVGFFVLTPLRLEGASQAILVQRGWVQRDFEQRARLPRTETPAGVVEVAGRIAPPPSKLYEPGTPAVSAIRQNLDVVQFSRETGLALLPVTLLQTGAASEGLLREWPAINLGVEKHYGYAAQWFGIALMIALLYLWFQVLQPFLHRTKDSRPHV